MEQKVIIAYDDDLKVVNEHLSKGWKVSGMKTCSINNSLQCRSACYFYLTYEK